MRLKARVSERTRVTAVVVVVVVVVEGERKKE